MFNKCVPHQHTHSITTSFFFLNLLWIGPYVSLSLLHAIHLYHRVPDFPF